MLGSMSPHGVRQSVIETLKAGRMETDPIHQTVERSLETHEQRSHDTPRRGIGDS